MKDFEHFVSFDAVSFSYDKSEQILKNFSWEIKKGQSWAILGPSGRGKSTILYLAAGLRKPDQGTIFIDNNAIVQPRPSTGLILQDFGLLPWETVKNNISLGLRIRNFYGPDGKHAPKIPQDTDIDKLTNHWLSLMGLDEIANKYPGQISGGQRQRTAIARTMALNPDLLLMDEPFASLDAPARKHLQEFIIKQALTKIIVTHSIEEALYMGENILVLGKTPISKPEIIPNPFSGNRNMVNSKEYINLLNNIHSMLESEP